MKIVILYSGGLDSFILKKYAEDRYPTADIKCLYYAHGADSEKQEIATLPGFVEVRTVEWLGLGIPAVAKKDDPFAGAIYIPGRNLVFCTLAACQEIPDEIWMGTLWDEDNESGTDKNEEFRRETSKLLSYVLSPFVKDPEDYYDAIQIRFPFAENGWTKKDCVQWALKTGITEQELTKTVSCWHHTGGKPCGQCKQCFKRWFVFFHNNISEEYQHDPVFSTYGKRMIEGYLTTYLKGEANKDESAVTGMIILAFSDPRFPEPLKKFIRKISDEYTKDKN